MVKKIKDMGQQGFPLKVDMVKQMAIKVLQHFEHEGELDRWVNVVLPTLGTHWISRFLDRHRFWH